jgi:hypothetical protein
VVASSWPFWACGTPHCDEFDSLTTEFPFVVQRGLPTDIVFGSDWCAYRRDVGVHHDMSLPLSELVVGDGA